MRRRVIVAAAGLALLVAGCGGGSDIALSAGHRADLMGRVASVRSALVAYTPDTARAELSTLRAEVARLQRRGQISDAQAQGILSAAAALESDFSLAPTTTTTTTTTTTAPLPQHGRGHDKEQKRPKGSGGTED
jgi:hypothetical protein